MDVWGNEDMEQEKCSACGAPVWQNVHGEIDYIRTAPKVKPLPMLERRNGYWGGKCSFGYQVAHTNCDLFRVRLHGKVICHNIKGFARAVKWANNHHSLSILSALE